MLEGLLVLGVLNAAGWIAIYLLQRQNRLVNSQEFFVAGTEKLRVAITQALGDDSGRMRADVANAHKNLREEVAGYVRAGHSLMAEEMRGTTAQQLTQLDVMSKQWAGIANSNEVRLRELQKTVDDRLLHIEKQSGERLESMRKTVEEKLEGTLERRLGDSFKMVGDRLELVQRGLGEMQALANGVGDLKRVLTNVKTRGTWGEVQLAMLLEQVLTQDQYEANAKVGKGADVVEFAIKLPGKDDDSGSVLLPIDSKFPLESYHRLLEAQDLGNSELAAVARRELEMAIKVSAKDIRDKYIHPPKTTDFALLFLPTEGLYAEVLRINGLSERLQVDYRITIAGPTTLAAILNSLQMGFRTLAIQKRSGEVWKILGAVKAEYGKFGGILDGVHKKLTEAAEKIDDASKKSKTIHQKLRSVEELSPAQADILLGASSLE